MLTRITRGLLLGGSTLSLVAQTAPPAVENKALPKIVIENLAKRGVKGGTALSLQAGPKQATQITKDAGEPGNGTCSVRLTEIQPPAEGTIVVLKPQKVEDNMPHLKLPAPPCPKQ
jgi:hypothetical protein